MAQQLSTSKGHVGQVTFIAPDGAFAKLLHDTTAILTWVFRADMPDGLKRGDRITFDVYEYTTKGQVRRKAVNVQIVAPLQVASVAVAPEPVVAMRAAKPRPLQPSAEATTKIANVTPQKLFRM